MFDFNNEEMLLLPDVIDDKNAICMKFKLKKNARSRFVFFLGISAVSL